ncbi:MAG: hypothetical protein EPN82_02350 [Bacteroidetes bacterium]|nr:MAG: hypothetical protein EPN82_02350 [Bacteroidota bacterium]
MKKFLYISSIVFLLYFNLQAEEKKIVKPELVVQTGHTALISKICYSPNGRYLASGDIDGLIILWDISQNKELFEIKGHEGKIHSLEISPDGNLLASSSYNEIKIWDILKGKEIRTILIKEEGELNLKLSPDGMYLASVNCEIGSYLEKSIIKLWDIKSGTLINSLDSNFLVLNSITFVPNSNKILFGSKYGSILVWEDFLTKKCYEINLQPEDAESYIVFSPNGKYVAHNHSGSLKIWDIDNLILAPFPTFDSAFKFPERYLAITKPSITKSLLNVEDISSFSFSYDSKYIGYVKERNILCIKEITTGKVIGVVRGNKRIISSISFSPFESNVATASYLDPDIIIWNYSTENIVQKLKGFINKIVDISVKEDGHSIACFNNDNSIRIWNIVNDIRIKKLYNDTTPISSFYYSPKNNTLIIGMGNGTIKLYDIDKFNERLQIKGLKSEILTISLSNNGRFLACSSSDTILCLWDLKNRAELKNKKIKADISIEFIGENSSIIGIGTKEIVHWDLKEDKCFSLTNGFCEHYSEFYLFSKLSPDRNYLITFGKDFNYGKPIPHEERNGYIYLLNLKTHECISIFAWEEDGDYYLAKEYLELKLREYDDFIREWALDFNNNLENFSYYYKMNQWGRILGYYYRFENDNIIIENNDRLFKPRKYDYSTKNRLIYFDKLNKEITSLFSIDSTDYIITTPDNYYTCSKGGYKGVAFRIGMHAYPFEQFDLRLNRPDIVLSRLGYASQELIDAYHDAYLKRLRKMKFKEEWLKEDYNLPTAEITNKDGIEYLYDKKKVTLKIKATDENYTLDRVNVYVNNVPIYGRNGLDVRNQKVKQIQKDVELTLSQGSNKIQVSVLNEIGVESLFDTKYIEYKVKEKKPDLYVIAIGISNYEYSMTNFKSIDLKFAHKDANDLCSIFKNQAKFYNQIHIIPMLNQNATRENILKLKDTLLKTKPDDVVLISFSGHGLLNDSLDYYLSTYNINPCEPEQNGLAFDELENILDSIPARQKLLFLDACHSGEVDKEDILAMDENKPAPKDNIKDIYYRGDVKAICPKKTKKKLGTSITADYLNELFINLNRGSGTIIISASKGVETAKETAEKQNGLFTFAVLKGFSKDITTNSLFADYDKDSKVTVSELRKFIIKEFDKYREVFKQTPNVRQENYEQDFPIFYY